MSPRTIDGRALGRLGLGLLFLLVGCGDGDRSADPASSGAAVAESGIAAIDHRIDFHRAQLAEDPRLYPVLALLAEAQLDRARLTRDVQDVEAAVDSARRSLEIQPTYAGLLVSTAIANFRHHFAEAIDFARQAARAAPGNEGTEFAMLVEALIGAGRVDEAAEVVAAGAGAVEFHRLAARARLAFETGDDEKALESWLSASTVARAQHVDSLAGWALIRAAAVRIDTDRAPEAGPFLEQAAKLQDEDADLATHRAEQAAAKGRPGEALTILGKVLARSKDPFAAITAAGFARAVGEIRRAEELEAFAEPVLRAAIEKGEVYTIGALARLEEGRGHWTEATELARRHASIVRDRGSREQLKRIEAKAAAAAGR